MDRGTWWAIVHGFPNRTGEQLTLLFYFFHLGQTGMRLTLGLGPLAVIVCLCMCMFSHSVLSDSL